MTEVLPVEAIRAAYAQPTLDPALDPAAGVSSAAPVADPAAVARFQAVMDADPVTAADPIPFANEASAAWRSAMQNHQGIVHRIRALTELDRLHGVSAPEMLELQYEVMNLSFQQEVVTKVADKSSTAIQTLIKNQ
jgi:type III secretion system YscI/HrpB-like protein